MSKLLSLYSDANYYLYRKPVRMSRSFDGLASLIRTELEKDILQGDVFIFLNRDRTMIKLFIYENKGYNIFYRRLDKGSFPVPLLLADSTSYKLSADQLLTLLNGVTLHNGGYIPSEKYEPLHGSPM